MELSALSPSSPSLSHSRDVPTELEAKILALEQQSLDQERVRLIESDGPLTCKSLIAAVSEITGLLANKDKKSTHLVSFEAENRVMSGAFRLNGFFISDAEVELHFRERDKRTTSFKFDISPNQPLRLHQLQDAHNYMQRVLQRLNEVSSQLSIAAYIKLFEDIASDIVNAKQSLLLNSKNIFPTMSAIPSVFQPSLPPELILEVSVAQKQVVLNAYLLSISAKPPASTSGKTPHSIYASFVPHCFKHKNKWIEVLEHTKCFVSLPELNEIFNRIAATHSIIADFLDKLCVLRGALQH